MNEQLPIAYYGQIKRKRKPLIEIEVPKPAVTAPVQPKEELPPQEQDKLAPQDQAEVLEQVPEVAPSVVQESAEVVDAPKVEEQKPARKSRQQRKQKTE